MTTATIDDLWSEYHSSIYQYIRKRIYSNSTCDQDIEDYVQDVFERALSAMQRGMGFTDNARGYIFRIAHNLVIDTYRQRERAGLTYVDVDAEPNPDTGSSLADTLQADDLPLDTLMVQQELQQRVHTAMASLTPNQQTVLTLRMADYTFEEIAEIMGKNEDAVKADAHRGRDALKLRLLQPRPRRTEAPPRGATSEKVDIRITALLTQRGPLRASEIAGALGLTTRHIQRVLPTRGDLFVVQPASDADGRIRLWGLA